MCAGAQIAAGSGHMLQACWQTISEEAIVKRTAFRSRKSPELPIAWREAEYAALRAIATDTCDDRVSEDIFDIEDERAEVEVIVHRLNHGVN